jgi:hypothetical protein
MSDALESPGLVVAIIAKEGAAMRPAWLLELHAAANRSSVPDKITFLFAKEALPGLHSNVPDRCDHSIR